MPATAVCARGGRRSLRPATALAAADPAATRRGTRDCDGAVVRAASPERRRHARRRNGRSWTRAPWCALVPARAAIGRSARCGGVGPAASRARAGLSRRRNRGHRCRSARIVGIAGARRSTRGGTAGALPRGRARTAGGSAAVAGAAAAARPVAATASAASPRGRDRAASAPRRARRRRLSAAASASGSARRVGRAARIDGGVVTLAARSGAGAFGARPRPTRRTRRGRGRRPPRRAMCAPVARLEVAAELGRLLDHRDQHRRLGFGRQHRARVLVDARRGGLRDRQRLLAVAHDLLAHPLRHRREDLLGNLGAGARPPRGRSSTGCGCTCRSRSARSVRRQYELYEPNFCCSVASR